MPKPHKPSLALDLARQAAAAAKAEVQAEMAPAAASSQGWKPAQLAVIELDNALQTAISQVVGHFANALRHEGLEVAPVAEKTQRVPTKEALTQGAETLAQSVQVREGGTGRVVRGYSAPALLGLFAIQQQRNGVVVDGQV